MLSGKYFPVFLDVEEQKRGEDEVSCSVRRQQTGEIEEESTELIWAINEMVIYWHADHLYCHHTAIVAFWLTLMLVLNLSRAFVYLNIKSELRSKHSNLYFARLMFSGLYDGSCLHVPP